MQNFIQEGNNIDVTLTANVNSGEGVLYGSLFGVAFTSGVTGEKIAIATRGVYELPKVEANTFADGAKVYWDDANKNCTSAATGNKLIGAVTEAAGAGSLNCRVRLNGVTV